MAAGDISILPWPRKKPHPGCYQIYIPDQEMPDGGRTKKFRQVPKRVFRGVEDARAWAKQKRAAIIEEYLAMRRGEIAAQDPKSKVPTFNALSEEWTEFLPTRAKKPVKPSSLDAIKSALRIHVLPHIGETRLHEFTAKARDELESKWMRGGYQYTNQFGNVVTVKGTSEPQTLNNRRTVVRAMLVQAVEWGYIPTLPCVIKVPKPPRKKKRDAFYEEDEYERLLAASLEEADLQVYVAFLLGGEAGFRRGEILALKWEDVLFKQNVIVVRRSVYHRKDERIEGTPKGVTEQELDMTDRLAAALRRLHKLREKETETVIAQEDGSPWTPKILRRAIAKVEKAVGMKKVSGRCHVLRHTFLSTLANRGATPLALQEVGRHTDLSVTQRYLHLRRGARRETIALLNKKEQSA